MLDPLADEEGGLLRYLFHTTSYAAIDAISADGLMPRAGSGVFKHGGYDLYSQGKIFAADGDAALGWFGKVEDQLQHHASDYGDLEDRAAEIVPVMLRLDLDGIDEEPLDDELGSRDVPSGGSYYFTKTIDPADIEFWHPKKRAWLPIDDGLPDPMLGIAAVEYYNEDGDAVDKDDENAEPSPGLTIFGPYEPGGFKPPYGVSNLARSFEGRRHGLRGPVGTVKAHKIRRGMRLWVEGAVREVTSTARAYGPSGGARGKHWVDIGFVGGGGVRVHGSSNVAVDDSNTVPYGPGW